MPRYLNSDSHLWEGNCIPGVFIAKLFKGKPLLLEKLSEYYLLKNAEFDLLVTTEALGEK